MPAIGNHDSETNDAHQYLESFFLPSDFPGSNERYYAFEAGPALFVSLDVFTSDFGPGSDQRAWLEQTLASSVRPWKFVFMHKGPYSCGSRHGGGQEVRRSMVPLFERYGVDIVFSGHDHDYERSRPILDFGSPGTPVLYVVSGGGGRRLHPWKGNCRTTEVAASTYEFVHVSVDGPCVSLTAVRPDGTTLDADSYCKLRPVSPAAPAATPR